MNAYVSKEINLSHCKIIVISEEIASSGVSSILYTLMNNPQIRPNCNIIVSKSDAKDFIKNMQPSLENLIAKFYEIAPTSSKYTGYTGNIKLGNFFNRYTSQTWEATAMLGLVDSKDENGFTSFTTENSSESSGSSSGGGAGQSSEENLNSEIIGLAVFKSDKLVGELTAEETLYHLLIQNDVENCYITLPRSKTDETPIDLYVYNKKKPSIKVDFVNGTPFIHVNLQLEAKLLSVDTEVSDMSKQKLKEYSNSANQYIKNKVEEYLYRTSTELQADIDGFGKHALCHFTTTQDFQNCNWKENYKNSFFDVTVNTDIQSSFLLSGK